jgi:hypothetical protein
MSIVLAGMIAATAGAYPSPTPTASATLTKFQREKLGKMKHSAPADEYFGKMKLSFLGIDNTFRDQAVRAGDHTVDGSVINRVDLANDSLRDWRRKYPMDPQLARSLFLGAKVYLKIWTTVAQQQAANLLLELRNKFPTTFFGKQAKVSLLRGFTMHVYGAALPCVITPGTATPTPAPVPTPNPKYNIKVSVEQAPCFVPTPAPSPSVSAPLPSPSPLRNAQPSPTPSPSAGPSPTPTPSGTPSASPLPSPSASAQPSPGASPTPR